MFLSHSLACYSGAMGMGSFRRLWGQKGVILEAGGKRSASGFSGGRGAMPAPPKSGSAEAYIAPYRKPHSPKPGKREFSFVTGLILGMWA